jgi:hypothetical protein
VFSIKSPTVREGLRTIGPFPTVALLTLHEIKIAARILNHQRILVGSIIFQTEIAVI